MTPPAGRREARLDALREEARRTGRVDAPGTRAAGGPLPAAGYYGRPVIKPPVWTWEIPVYFFVGGTAGMAAVIAAAAAAADPGAALGGRGATGAVVRAALLLAVAGSAASSLLLVLDLGRPARFLHMLRVFKWRSPMSVGAWTLAAFGGAVAAAALLLAGLDRWELAGPPLRLVEALAAAALAAGALLGAMLATYTGVLLGATAVPAWFTHVRALPVHFGLAALGSAAAALELLGLRLPALHALGLAAAGAEIAAGAWTELRRHGAADRALREGRSGRLLRTSAVLAGPVSLAARVAGLVPVAAGAFLAGALLGRFGWLAAGRASALDPEATFASQRED